ncbi:MAG: cysteine--tRNA ligase [Candidatus Aenigmatarchaeota archaeon]
MLKLYNTMTRKKEIFKPLKDKEVRMYTCGPTVYDYAHIGNFRAYIFEDLLRRVIEYNGYKVKHVMNFTDVGHLTSDADTGEDKMVVGAERERKSAWEIAEFYINAFKEDMKLLRIKEPHIWCRATDHIKEMIDLIKRLEEKGYTYHTNDGIYFDTSKLKKYGFPWQDFKGLKAGARVEVVEGKRNPTDFALWKFSPKDKKRDMEWDSPWGVGFPGWHIECSAMSMKYLGETFDIHCGGIDHITVHHPNEIAQSESATGKKFVNFWLHNEFMLVNGQKMAKSLGNFYTLRDLIAKGYDPIAFRYLCLSSHYRSQLNFTFDALESAKKTVDTFNDFIFRINEEIKTTKIKNKNKKILSAVKKAKNSFERYINDDLNTPNALAAIFDMMKIVNKEIDSRMADKTSLKFVYKFLIKINEILDIIEIKEEKLTDEEKKLILEREEARKRKDYKRADEIRAQLRDKGIILEDTPEGVRWKKSK